MTAQGVLLLLEKDNPSFEATAVLGVVEEVYFPFVKEAAGLGPPHARWFAFYANKSHVLTSWLNRASR